MKDDQTLNTLRIFVKVVNVFNGTPYEWDKKEKCLRLSSNLKKRICVSLAKWNIWIYLAYLIVCLAGEILGAGHVDFVVVIWLLIWILYYVWSAISFRNAQVSCSIVTALFKGMKTLFAEMAAKYPQQFSNKPAFLTYNILQMQIMAVLWILASLVVAFSSMFLVIPLKPQYISSQFEKGIQNPLVFAGFILLEIYSKASTGLVSGTDALHILVPINCNSSIRHKIHDFRTLNVLVASFNHSVTKELLSFLCYWGPGGFVLIAGFATIRFHGEVNIFEYAPFPLAVLNCSIVLFLVLFSTSTVGKVSEKLLNSINQQSPMSGRRKTILRQMKSLKTFGVEAGSIKVIERIVILKILYVISDILTTCLVTFPKEAVFS
ncbi:hypothetical protein Fcan01_19823 [Folsomia candida]|uniref:Gustatory receptor n=1 Tax=Folsomia candida TaxID=158441 RepID=A0A226DIH1_FOLCA|nr:hypothetical protein Fcan01_19823 [Folsomia candida]